MGDQKPLFEDDSATAAISAIVPLQSDPNMRRILVGRRTMATLRASDIESLQLKVGQAWTEACAKAVLDEVAANKARQDAMKLLGRRAHSHGEIVQKLSKKGYQRVTASRIADELAADGWINDEAFGRAIIDQATRRKPAAERLLLDKLQQRKLEPGIAQRIAREAMAGIDPVEKALDMARDRLSDWEPMPPAKAARRIADMLARRGFDEQVVTDVLARLRLDAHAD